MKLYLVRHGSAGIRHDGDPADTERHLDAYGLRQAVQLAARLAFTATDADADAEVVGADQPITVVLSSPAARCVETVEPLASALGLDVEIDDRLMEGTDVEQSWALVKALVDHHEIAVLCSHGDVIPELIRRAKGRGMEVPGKSGCSKGSLWTLDWDGERFDSGCYEPNPAER